MVSLEARFCFLVQELIVDLLVGLLLAVVVERCLERCNHTLELFIIFSS